jgi:hypothetical protein
MFSVLSLLGRVRLLRVGLWSRGRIKCRKKISGSFYIEARKDTGANAVMRVEARRLVRRERELYVCGWCHCVPRFNSIPVSQIVTLVDSDTGELILQDEIETWLRGRILH